MYTVKPRSVLRSRTSVYHYISMTNSLIGDFAHNLLKKPSHAVTLTGTLHQASSLEERRESFTPTVDAARHFTRIVTSHTTAHALAAHTLRTRAHAAGGVRSCMRARHTLAATGERSCRARLC